MFPWRCVQLSSGAVGASVAFQTRFRRESRCQAAATLPKETFDEYMQRCAAKDHALSRYQGLSVPKMFKPESQKAFQNMRLKDDDVIMVSYPKCGTTWAHQILYCLLRMDHRGRFTVDTSKDPSADGQVYPDCVPLERPEEPLYPFGFSSQKDLIDQCRPRLFSTDLPPPMLPTEGLRTQGRLVYVVRNPKDALTSMHFFARKVYEGGHNPLLKARVDEGWLGDASKGTLGSFARFNCWGPEHSPEFFGSFYEHVRSMGELVDEVGSGRATVVYYEQLHEDFDKEMSRLARLLGVSLTEEKLQAIRERVKLDNMKDKARAASRPSSGITLRKGVVGDYRQHLTPAHWAQMDALFEERLGDVAIAKPLKRWM
mmetsp:Transcript_81860/g.226880  ORF Transcript_81860/g.226880 Transcript_81860/m.226880 type:complete len:371 (-) Transcript_81860:130-1242(-)